MIIMLRMCVTRLSVATLCLSSVNFFTVTMTVCLIVPIHFIPCIPGYYAVLVVHDLVCFVHLIVPESLSNHLCAYWSLFTCIIGLFMCIQLQRHCPYSIFHRMHIIFNIVYIHLTITPTRKYFDVFFLSAEAFIREWSYKWWLAVFIDTECEWGINPYLLLL